MVGYPMVLPTRFSSDLMLLTARSLASAYMNPGLHGR